MINPLQLREILINVGEKIKCPECKTKIRPTEIDIETGKGKNANHCFFDMHCHVCDTSFSGRVEMISMPTDFGKKLNESSRLKEEWKANRLVSLEDKQNIHSTLEHITSFSGLFPSPKTTKKPIEKIRI